MITFGISDAVLMAWTGVVYAVAAIVAWKLGWRAGFRAGSKSTERPIPFLTSKRRGAA